MRCPRCHRESPRPAPFCGGCGAPLLLRDEPARPLDGTLELDRRGPAPEDAASVSAGFAPAPLVPPPIPPAAHGTAELAAVERSHWDLRLPERPPETPGPGALRGREEGLPEPDVDVLEVHVERAAGWRRAAAWAVDAVPFAIAGVAFGRSLVRDATAGLPPPSGVDGLLDLFARERVIVLSVLAAVTLALAVYATLSHALGGATLGKRLLHLRVIGPDGAPPSPGRSAARSALAVASAGLVGLGFVLALFTRSGRALHDLIARTWVVKAP